MVLDELLDLFDRDGNDNDRKRRRQDEGGEPQKQGRFARLKAMVQSLADGGDDDDDDRERRRRSSTADDRRYADDDDRDTRRRREDRDRDGFFDFD